MSPCPAVVLGSGLAGQCEFFRPLCYVSPHCRRRISPMPRMAAAAAVVEAEASTAPGAGAEASTAARPLVVSTAARPPVAFMAGVCGAFLGRALVASTLADFPAAAFAPIQHR